MPHLEEKRESHPLIIGHISPLVLLEKESFEIFKIIKKNFQTWSCADVITPGCATSRPTCKLDRSEDEDLTGLM